MFKEVKNDVLKSIVIVLGIVVFVVGIVVAGSGFGDTYALKVDDYDCPLGGGTPVYAQIHDGVYGYYCAFSEVSVASSSFSVGDSVKDDANCEKYLGELGYTQVTTDVGYYCTYVAVVKSCYYCASSNTYEWTSSPSTSCPGGINWTKKTNITDSANCKVPTTYTIVFDTDGGNTIATKYITEGGSFVAPEAEKTGYIFKYWRNISNSAQYVVGQTITPSSGMTLKAIYDEGTTDIESKKYIVYFYNGSTKVDEKSCTKTDAEEHCTVYVPSTEPTLEGHTFKGWSKDCDDSGTDKYKETFYVNDKNDGAKYYACFEENESYTVTYDANGGYFTDAFLEDYNSEDYEFCNGNTACEDYAHPVLGVSYIVWPYDDREMLRDGHTFVGWKDQYGNNVNTGEMIWNYNEDITFYAQWQKNSTGDSGNAGDSGNTGNSGNESETTITYLIKYVWNGGTITDNPTSGTKDEVITIKQPTKTINIIGNANKTEATIGKNVSVTQKFAGWTSNNIDTKNAYYGDKLWSNGNTKVTDTKFKNLSITNGATVTLVANWLDASTTLPTVTKDGYTCKWNTKSDGQGTSYNSGAKYTISGNSSSSINLYAICEVNSKADEEITTNNKTGDALIYTVWVVGIGALGYAVYHFMRRRNNI